MSDPFLAEIVMFGGTFAPRGWAFCDGTILPINQYQALFSLLGTTYGGDGRVTFGLPDLRGRVAMHKGNGPGLTSRSLGQKGGTETNPLSEANLPSHAHTFAPPSNSGAGNTDVATGHFPAQTSEDNYNTVGGAAMGQGTTGPTGSSTPVNNVQPFQCVNFIMALQGTFPS